MKMKRFAINVTSECVSAADGRTYNSDKFEGRNEVYAESAKAAIEEEIRNMRLEGKTIWYSEESACVVVPLPDGGEKDYFFEAAEVTE